MSDRIVPTPPVSPDSSPRISQECVTPDSPVAQNAEKYSVSRDSELSTPVIVNRTSENGKIFASDDSIKLDESTLSHTNPLSREQSNSSTSQSIIFKDKDTLENVANKTG